MMSAAAGLSTVAAGASDPSWIRYLLITVSGAFTVAFWAAATWRFQLARRLGGRIEQAFSPRPATVVPVGTELADEVPFEA
ncbi:MAG: hypothetical protein HY815_09205 [Candidatus Riflebacteria bacterium]|nr:hypothetical protein [Candidatus Riflebacteria bacterium]